MSRQSTARTSSGTFRALRHRPFRLFFLTQLSSQIGNWLTMIAAALWVLELTDDNAFAVGVLTACQFAPLLLFGLLAGVLSDRSDKKRLLMIVVCCSMLQSIGLGLLALLDDPPLLAIYGVSLFGGVALVFDNPTRRSLLVELVPVEDLPNAVSLNLAMMTSSRVVGPALAGVLIVTVGYAWCFAVDGLSYLPVLVGLSMIRRSDRVIGTPAARAKGQVRDGLRYVRSMPQLFVPIVMMAIIGMTAVNYTVVLPVFVKNSLGSTEVVYTLLYSVLSLGCVVSALVMARRTALSVQQVITGAVCFGIALLVLAASPGVPAAFVIAFLVGFASIMFSSSAIGIIQTEARPDMRGRVLAAQAMVYLGTAPIGGPIIGALCQVVSPRAGLAAGAVGCLGAAGWARRSHRRLTTHASTATT